MANKNNAFRKASVCAALVLIGLLLYRAGYNHALSRTAKKPEYPKLESAGLLMNGGCSLIVAIQPGVRWEIVWASKGGASGSIRLVKHEFRVNPDYPKSSQRHVIVEGSLEEGVLEGMLDRLFESMQKSGDPRAPHIGNIRKILKGRDLDADPGLLFWFHGLGGK